MSYVVGVKREETSSIWLLFQKFLTLCSNRFLTYGFMTIIVDLRSIPEKLPRVYDSTVGCIALYRFLPHSKDLLSMKLQWLMNREDLVNQNLAFPKHGKIFLICLLSFFLQSIVRDLCIFLALSAHCLHLLDLLSWDT